MSFFMDRNPRDFSKKAAQIGPTSGQCHSFSEVPAKDTEKMDGPDLTAGAQESVVFLGHEYSIDNYRETARNLAGFFSILSRWADKEMESEKKSGQ
jgi:hypothetical protein